MTYADYVKNWDKIHKEYAARNAPDTSKCEEGCPFFRPLVAGISSRSAKACHYCLDTSKARRCDPKDCDLEARQKEFLSTPGHRFSIPPRSEDLYI